MANAVPTIPVQTLRQIAQTLLAKTKAGEVNWILRDSNSLRLAPTQALPGEVRRPRNQAPRDTTYEVLLPQSRIVLSYGVPRVEADFVSFQLQNPDGVVVDSFAVDEPDWGDADNPTDPEEVDPEGDWRLFHGLWTEVHKQATGWDKVVSDVQRALTSGGRIGMQSGARQNISTSIARG